MLRLGPSTTQWVVTQPDLHHMCRSLFSPRSQGRDVFLWFCLPAEAVFTGDEAAPSPFKSASDAASADAAAPTGPGEDEGCGTVVPPTISRRSAGGTGRGVSSRRRSSRGGRHVAFADRLSTSSGAAIPPPGVETTATVSMSSDPGATCAPFCPGHSDVSRYGGAMCSQARDAICLHFCSLNDAHSR